MNIRQLFEYKRFCFRRTSSLPVSALEWFKVIQKNDAMNSIYNTRNQKIEWKKNPQSIVALNKFTSFL